MVARWTDRFGRSYEFTPYQAAPIRDLDIAFASEVGLAVAEAAARLASVPTVPSAGIARCCIDRKRVPRL